MAVPLLLVTGFLGAGKTTVVNHILAHADGRRIAAVVNDFGAINIDAELVAGADGVVSLANGCICCSLEGDLLRTVATLLRRMPAPDAIVVEASGIADPADIVRNLMDPVVFRAAPLDAVLCVVDAAANLADPLLRAQIRAADIVALTKTDLSGTGADPRAAIRAIKPAVTLAEAPFGRVPLELLFPGEAPVARAVARARPRSDRFHSFCWTSAHRVSLPRLQAAIGRLAPMLARAKGVFECVEQPGAPLLLQFAGGRATLSPAAAQGGPAARIVFITELGTLPDHDAQQAMDACVARPELQG